jgi:hypothetical protein
MEMYVLPIDPAYNYNQSSLNVKGTRRTWLLGIQNHLSLYPSFCLSLCFFVCNYLLTASSSVAVFLLVSDCLSLCLLASAVFLATFLLTNSLWM